MSTLFKWHRFRCVCQNWAMPSFHTLMQVASRSAAVGAIISYFELPSAASIHFLLLAILRSSLSVPSPFEWSTLPPFQYPWPPALHLLAVCFAARNLPFLAVLSLLVKVALATLKSSEKKCTLYSHLSSEYSGVFCSIIWCLLENFAVWNYLAMLSLDWCTHMARALRKQWRESAVCIHSSAVRGAHSHWTHYIWEPHSVQSVVPSLNCLWW